MLGIPDLLINLSVKANEATRGPKGWSLCARAWEARLDGKAWGFVFCYAADSVFLLDNPHCRKSWLRCNKYLDGGDDSSL